MRLIVSGALLAGGRGSRMAISRQDRIVGKLDMDLSGMSLAERSMQGLIRAFPDACVVAKDGYTPLSLLKYRIVHDSNEGFGPAAGIAAALSAFQGWCFIAAADMPFLDADLICRFRDMLEALPEEVCCAVPVWCKGAEPLHAFYRTDALGRILNFLKSGRRGLNELTKELGARFINAEDVAKVSGSDLEIAFYNVNTLEDFERARVIINKLGI